MVLYRRQIKVGDNSRLFQDADVKIARYNQLCLHYNLVADAVYGEWHRSRKPFAPGYRPYLVAALLSFDMGRMMGSGLVVKYDVAAGGFAARLDGKLARVSVYLDPLIDQGLFQVDIAAHSRGIVRAYNVLAADGERGLHEQGKAFHVGATKILHFLNPELFTIVDANTARTLKAELGISYRSGTQPGYSGERYVGALSEIKKRIRGYGIERFRSLEPGTPTLRIFDKLAFVYGAGL
jgi:hypothetical protein